MRKLHRANAETPNKRFRSLILAIIITAVTLFSSPAQAEAVRAIASESVESAKRLLNKLISPFPSHRQGQAISVQQAQSPADRAARVTHFRLCPRRLMLYSGEDFTLSPTPLDRNREVVHGVPLTWSINNPEIATVSSWGEVTAIAPGNTLVTVRAGTAHANATVEIRAGVRARRSDLEWEIEHGHDCDEPEASELNNPSGDLAELDSRTAIQTEKPESKSALKQLARPAALHAATARKNLALKPASSQKVFSKGFFPLIDGEGPDTFAANATQFYNALGTPRFGPQEASAGSATETKNDLGSYNYLFTTPVLNLGGRGIGTDLALSYNSRPWNKDGSQMTFNYNKGWPAAGWTLGYGRIIENYDNTATGNGSGQGLNNSSGNDLLIQPDGTRIHLAQVYDSTEHRWKHDSTDGTFLHLSYAGSKLKYPDGTIVDYDTINNRLLPASIETRNGDLITIAYRNRTSSFHYRWAIDTITDTLGRVIQFKYYGDAGYPADPANGKPDGALAAITAPDFSSGTRTLVQLYYRDITLLYDFGAMSVVSPGNNSQLTVVSKIYYPQTGRGYLFLDHSSYGMARTISTRIGMTETGGIVTDGTETAYTKYNYTSIDTQVGPLDDSPQYTTRSEWWQNKTDANGNPDNTPSVYTYSRNVGLNTETDTVIYPNGLRVDTTTDSNPSSGFTGVVYSVVYNDSQNNVLRAVNYLYTTGPDGGTQVASVQATDEAGQSTKMEYGYENYGRVKNVYEDGYAANGSFVVRRRTMYKYLDLDTYLSVHLLRLVTEVRGYDGLLDNDNGNDVLMSKTVYSYDDYKKKGGMTYYGYGAAPNHDETFSQSYTLRGNVTGVQTFSKFSPDVSTTKYNGYDEFGNVVVADVSCCSVKSFSFALGPYYSQPDAATNGKPGVVPFVTTNFEYDFNTGLPMVVTDPYGQITRYLYDSAWRLLSVVTPTYVWTTTTFDKDANGKDLLAYSQRVTADFGTAINKSWLDGAGRPIRTGNGAQANPQTFDAIATVYDSMGRAAKQSNPYPGNDQGVGSPSQWTTSTYDTLSRVTRVTLPDTQFIQTDYAGATATSGATVTVTDQVGRKRKSEVDGLGRVVKVIEQNPATGLLDDVNYATTYSYNALDNLTQVNQGNQTRSFQYDALARLTQQTTPEAGTVNFTYTSFDALLKRTDARNVETHFKYDALNRPLQTWYTGIGGSDDGSVRPSLPAGVAATADVVLAYNNFTFPQAGNGLLHQVTDGAGSATYNYRF